MEERSKTIARTVLFLDRFRFLFCDKFWLSGIKANVKNKQFLALLKLHQMLILNENRTNLKHITNGKG